MTRRRAITLVVGVLGLAAFSWWRLKDDSPPLPARPGQVRPGDGSEGREQVLTFTGQTMGTTFTVKYVKPRKVLPMMAEQATQAALDAVSASMSTYDPSSELSKINRALPEQLMPLSEELAFVLDLSRTIHGQTEGAFDVTVGPLVNLYGFGPAKDGPPPTSSDVAAMRDRVGMQHVDLDAKARTIKKLAPGVEIDLSAIAKGYGVDQVAVALERLGIESYMVEVGGEIRVRGEKPDVSPWKLAIEEPQPNKRAIHATLALPREGGALATSGDYRNFREVDGKLVSHTFDPRTLRPTPRRTASVSVVRPTAAEADGLATALGVLTPDEAIEVANRHAWAVYLLVHVDSKGREPTLAARKSKAFEKLDFVRVAAP